MAASIVQLARRVWAALFIMSRTGKRTGCAGTHLLAELTSNNEAEYAALYLSLQELDLLNVHHLPVRFIGDSQVVINQMGGEWPTARE